MCFFNIKRVKILFLYQIHKIMISKKASYDPFKDEFITKNDNCKDIVIKMFLNIKE